MHSSQIERRVQSLRTKAKKTLKNLWWSNFSSRLLALMNMITVHMPSIFLDMVRNASNTSYHQWPFLTKSMLEDHQQSLNTFALRYRSIIPTILVIRLRKKENGRKTSHHEKDNSLDLFLSYQWSVDDGLSYLKKSLHAQCILNLTVYFCFRLFIFTQWFIRLFIFLHGISSIQRESWLFYPSWKQMIINIWLNNIQLTNDSIGRAWRMERGEFRQTIVDD